MYKLLYASEIRVFINIFIRKLAGFCRQTRQIFSWCKLLFMKTISLHMVKPGWQNCPHNRESICRVPGPYWNPWSLEPLIHLSIQICWTQNTWYLSLHNCWEGKFCYLVLWSLFLFLPAYVKKKWQPSLDQTNLLNFIAVLEVWKIITENFPMRYS